MVHLSAPGVRVAGVGTAGLPGVIIGHNERIAWGFTNVGPDVQDLYVEKFNPDNPKQYQTPSGWQDAVIRREEIKVRKGIGSSEHDIVNHDVTVTRHGPIIFEGDGKRYALRWTALDPSEKQSRFDVGTEPRTQLERVQRRARIVYRADAEHRLCRRRWSHRLSRGGRGADQEVGRWQCAVRWIDRCR